MVLPVKESMSWWNQSNSRSGFTFLELLVTTSLGLLVLAGALASYRTFGQRQARAEAARAVIGTLQRAQRRARAGEQPVDNCNTFQGYRVRATQNTQQFFLTTRCDDQDMESQAFSLQDQNYFLTGFDVTFSPHSGPVLSTPTQVQIGPLGGGQDYYLFVIEPNGLVTDSGLIEN